MKIIDLNDGVYFVDAETEVKDLGYLRIEEKNIYSEKVLEVKKLKYKRYNYGTNQHDDIEEEYEVKEIIGYEYSLPSGELFEDYLKKIGFDHQEVWFISPYEVNRTFVMNKEPKKLSYVGSGFNYGSSNLIEVEKPGRILIAAEND